MPVEKDAGGTTITGNAINYFQVLICKQAMEMHLKFGGTMRLTRTATPKRLREIATSYTGVKYARSTAGMQEALEDMKTILASRTPDAVVRV